jgi:adenine-specific DNA-methyltransferase
VQIKNIKYPTNEALYNFQIEYKNHVFSIRDISQKLKNEYFTEKHKNFILHKGATKNTILWKGGEVVFFSNKVKKVNGQDVSIKYLSDIWTDISWDGIANEGGVKLKKGKKPERLIERIISMAGLGKNDIVLDFFAGTATTCAVAHKMGCQYIGIEQLDYGDNDSVKRLQNVINGDQSGISKAVNWHGGGNFIYFELAKWNETAKEKILETKSLDELEKLFDELYYKYFLNYNLKIKEFKEKVILEKEFKTLPLDEQKKMFLTMLDLNQMYVQKTEMTDEKFGIKKEDQDLTLKFYGDD